MNHHTSFLGLSGGTFFGGSEGVYPLGGPRETQETCVVVRGRFLRLFPLFSPLQAAQEALGDTRSSGEEPWTLRESQRDLKKRPKGGILVCN